MEKKKSWKTSISGIATILIAILGAVQLLFDGKPETNPNWEVTIGLVTAGLSGLFARDKNVSSEQAGVKPQ